MNILGLFACVLFVLGFGIVNAFPYPGREIRSPSISGNLPDLSPILRRTRAAEESKKDDLEGAESAFITYPYVGWPYAYGYYAPPVVYVG